MESFNRLCCKIYALVFTIGTAETNEDGSIDLNENTVVPSNALLRTCQQIYNESRGLCRAAYHDYPATHTFVIDMPDRKQPVPVPAVSKAFSRRIKSFRVNWRADEHNKGQPLRFTSHFLKTVSQPRPWAVRVELHDPYWRGERASKRLLGIYRDAGNNVMDGYRGRWSAHLVARLVHQGTYGPENESYVWGSPGDAYW
jgi:hypothetical protein